MKKLEISKMLNWYHTSDTMTIDDVNDRIFNTLYYHFSAYI